MYITLTDTDTHAHTHTHHTHRYIYIYIYIYICTCITYTYHMLCIASFVFVSKAFVDLQMHGPCLQRQAGIEAGRQIDRQTHVHSYVQAEADRR